MQASRTPGEMQKIFWSFLCKNYSKLVSKNCYWEESCCDLSSLCFIFLSEQQKACMVGLCEELA